MLYLYCLGSLGDLMISLSPALSSRCSGSSAAAPSWTGPDAGQALDLFVCGILGRDDDTVGQPRRAGQLAVSGTFLPSPAARRANLNRASRTRSAQKNQESLSRPTRLNTHQSRLQCSYSHTVWWFRPVLLDVS